MTTWFTADLHFDHANILKYTKRPWPSVMAMNHGLVERWNAVVAPEDTVFVLGDFAMGKRAESVPWARLLHGSIILVPGNHDACWDQGRDGAGSTPTRTANNVANYKTWGGFADVWQPPVTGFTLEGTPVTLSHLPPLECGDHKGGEIVYSNEIRFAQRRPALPPPGEYLLCGHVHEVWKHWGNVINVGVDVWDWQPVSAVTLATYITTLRKEERDVV